MISSLLAAFVLGLLGSVHCVGMCGPLVLSLPVQQLKAERRALAIGLYHSGRIAVYALAGLLFGLLGRRVYLAGWQQGLSVTLGVLILLGVMTKSLRGHGRLPGWAASYFKGLQAWMGRLWNSSSRWKFLWMGIANGLLPCGMVYMAVAGALTSSALGQAVGFMVFFGLGTLPMLLGLQMTRRMVGVQLRFQIRRALPYLTACVAVLLILRGLNLGIPLVSPVLAGRPPQAVICH